MLPNEGPPHGACATPQRTPRSALGSGDLQGLAGGLPVSSLSSVSLSSLLLSSNISSSGRVLRQSDSGRSAPAARPVHPLNHPGGVQERHDYGKGCGWEMLTRRPSRPATRARSAPRARHGPPHLAPDLPSALPAPEWRCAGHSWAAVSSRAGNFSERPTNFGHHDRRIERMDGWRRKRGARGGRGTGWVVRKASCAGSTGFAPARPPSGYS